MTKIKKYRYPLDMPPELEKKLKDMASAENRSLNGQIVHILKETVEARKHDK